MRAKRPADRRRVAPVPLRVALIAAVSALVTALVGGSDGFWLAMPAVLLAGSIAATPAGTLACAGPVLTADAAAASLGRGGSLPALWLVVIVPAGCLMVLQGMAGRLRRERDAMEHAAFSDALTGVANRRLLMSVADHEVARHSRADERFTVVMLDLDGFKLLNDRYGHAAGDQMLRDVAARLSRTLRHQDTVARLGGDEFCVIAPDRECATAGREDRRPPWRQRQEAIRSCTRASGSPSSRRTEGRSSCCCAPPTSGCCPPSAGCMPAHRARRIGVAGDAAGRLRHQRVDRQGRALGLVRLRGAALACERRQHRGEAGGGGANRAAGQRRCGDRDRLRLGDLPGALGDRPARAARVAGDPDGHDVLRDGDRGLHSWHSDAAAGSVQPEWGVDGADEVDPHNRVLKGRGGAMFMEKILWTTCQRMYLAIDPSKRVERLGQGFPIPIEVHRSAVGLVGRALDAHGCARWTLRLAAGKDGPIVDGVGEPGDRRLVRRDPPRPARTAEGAPRCDRNRPVRGLSVRGHLTTCDFFGTGSKPPTRGIAEMAVGVRPF